MKIKNLALSLGLVLLAVGCGSVEEHSSLKAPPVSVYRFNATGEGNQGAWSIPTADCSSPRDTSWLCPAARAMATFAVIGQGARGDKILIDGPVGINLSPSGSGYVNVNAEVVYSLLPAYFMAPIPASIVAELVYGDVNNPTVIGSTVINFSSKDDFAPLTASIPGKAFPHSLENVRVRIRNYQMSGPISLTNFGAEIYINETRILYN